MADNEKESLSGEPEGLEAELLDRRDFLVGLGKWSKVVIGGVVLGGALLAEPEATAQPLSGRPPLGDGPGPRPPLLGPGPGPGPRPRPLPPDWDGLGPGPRPDWYNRRRNWYNRPRSWYNRRRGWYNRPRWVNGGWNNR